MGHKPTGSLRNSKPNWITKEQKAELDKIDISTGKGHAQYIGRRNVITNPGYKAGQKPVTPQPGMPNFVGPVNQPTTQPIQQPINQPQQPIDTPQIPVEQPLNQTEQPLQGQAEPSLFNKVSEFIREPLDKSDPPTIEQKQAALNKITDERKNMTLSQDLKNTFSSENILMALPIPEGAGIKVGKRAMNKKLVGKMTAALENTMKEQGGSFPLGKRIIEKMKDFGKDNLNAEVEEIIKKNTQMAAKELEKTAVKGNQIFENLAGKASNGIQLYMPGVTKQTFSAKTYYLYRDIIAETTKHFTGGKVILGIIGSLIGLQTTTSIGGKMMIEWGTLDNSITALSMAESVAVTYGQKELEEELKQLRQDTIEWSNGPGSWLGIPSVTTLKLKLIKIDELLSKTKNITAEEEKKKEEAETKKWEDIKAANEANEQENRQYWAMSPEERKQKELERRHEEEQKAKS